MSHDFPNQLSLKRTGTTPQILNPVLSRFASKGLGSFMAIAMFEPHSFVEPVSAEFQNSRPQVGILEFCGNRFANKGRKSFHGKTSAERGCASPF